MLTPRGFMSEREAQSGAHTVSSHGVRVARTYLIDWVMLILLGLIIACLNILRPFHRFIGRDMMSDLQYPHKSSTVPFWAVPIYAVLLPIVVFLLTYLRQRDVYDLHHAILGILFSAFITGAITDSIKAAVGRPRPDFFWRCFPDGLDVYDILGDVVCHGDEMVIRQGHKSFPSGHTSWSFAGLGFFSLYLSGKIKAFDGRGHVGKLCMVLLPLVFACLVGISRVDDYRHHWQDMFAGGLIGLVVASCCYLQFFPPPYHVDGWRTHEHSRVVEASYRNSNNVRCQDAGIEIQPTQNDNNSERGFSASGNSNIPVDVESGTR